MNRFHISIAFLGVLIGGLSITLKRKHLLSVLLRLEFIVLNVFLLLLISSVGFMFSAGVLGYLVVTVCEGVLGLTLLIRMIRSSGNDSIALLSLT